MVYKFFSRKSKKIEMNFIILVLESRLRGEKKNEKKNEDNLNARETHTGYILKKFNYYCIITSYTSKPQVNTSLRSSPTPASLKTLNLPVTRPTIIDSFARCCLNLFHETATTRL